MGTFQSGINNILGTTAAVATAIKASADREKQMEVAKAEAEQKDIEETSEKLADARKMAIGYSESEIKRDKAAAALGIESNKLPKSIKQKTYDRRYANAKAMEEIQNQYIQKKEFRDKLKNYKHLKTTTIKKLKIINIIPVN